MVEKELIIFDLDGTLTPSRSPIERETRDLFLELLERKKVAVISGSDFTQFDEQLLSHLPTTTNVGNLYLLPTSGTRLLTWRDYKWKQQYAEDLSVKERQMILQAVTCVLGNNGYTDIGLEHGPAVFDRGSQITFSGLPINAPLSEKLTWDPDHTKRKAMVAELQEKIPGYQITIGGTSSIDITKQGIDKAYGIKKIMAYTHVEPEKILFVGDALFPEGNDFPATKAGVECRRVASTADTRALIKELL